MTTQLEQAASPDSTTPTGSQHVMREAEVLLAIGEKSKATLNRWMRDGKFPRPLKEWPGKDRVWARASVEQFFASLVGATR